MKLYLLAFLIVLFISSQASNANKKHPLKHEKSFFLSTSEIIPKELSIMIKSMQISPSLPKSYQTDKKNIKIFRENIIELNQLFSLLNKEEISFFSKAIIYKSIIKKYAYLPPKRSSFTAPIVKDLLNFKKINQKKIRPFTHWLIDTLIRDFNQLQTSKDYKDFTLNFKKPVKIKDKNYQIIYKKMSVLLVWYEKILTQDLVTLNRSVNKFMHEILSKIIIVTKNYFTLSKETGLPQLANIKELVLFPFKEWKAATSLFHNQSLDEILAPVLNQTPDKNFKISNKLPEPVNDWMPTDNPKIEQNIDVKMNRAILDHRINPNYVTPKNLPKPVNDW